MIYSSFSLNDVPMISRRNIASRWKWRKTKLYWKQQSLPCHHLPIHTIL